MRVPLPFSRVSSPVIVAGVVGARQGRGERQQRTARCQHGEVSTVVNIVSVTGAYITVLNSRIEPASPGRMVFHPQVSVLLRTHVM